MQLSRMCDCIRESGRWWWWETWIFTIPCCIRILWQDKKHRISDVGCSLLQIWLNPNQTALKGFHQIASLRTHKQPCLGIRKPRSKFWVWGEILLARILLLLSILNFAIFCVDSSLSQDWKVGEHLCWDFPIFSQVVVVFGVQCRCLIHPDDVPQNWQQEGAEEKQKIKWIGAIFFEEFSELI